MKTSEMSESLQLAALAQETGVCMPACMRGPTASPSQELAMPVQSLYNTWKGQRWETYKEGMDLPDCETPRFSLALSETC